MVAPRLNGNGHGVPIIGQEKSFDVQQHSGPMMFPTSQLIPNGNGATLHIFGGLSKFEYFVGQALANSAMADWPIADVISRVQSVCDALEKDQGTAGE